MNAKVNIYFTAVTDGSISVVYYKGEKKRPSVLLCSSSFPQVAWLLLKLNKTLWDLPGTDPPLSLPFPPPLVCKKVLES